MNGPVVAATARRIGNLPVARRDEPGGDNEYESKSVNRVGRSEANGELGYGMVGEVE